MSTVPAALVLTNEFEDALERLEAGANLFLTGKAGTGKSTLIRHFLRTTERNTVVVAPTGIAALNVQGYTIHRLFSFQPGITPSDIHSGRYYPARFANTLKSVETLIIDEVSMVRADLFDSLVAALEKYGPHPSQPYGGVQVVLVGDLYQLPPVVTDAERQHFRTRYASPYFFSADTFNREDFSVIELTHIFRQTGDHELTNLLNAVREGQLLEEARAHLNSRTFAEFRPPIDEMWLTLTTTNRIAAARNREMLALIDDHEYHHVSAESGDLTGFDLPTDSLLRFKVGAQVMLLNNDSGDRWVNGTIGRIIGYRIDKQGTATVDVGLPDGRFVDVRPYTWEITRPIVAGGSLRHEVVGSFTQLPFQLAWAITIHKSQGQTLERVVVDLTGGTFSDGQLYVALSRCTSFDGLVLRRDVEAKHLRTDPQVRRFLHSTILRSQPRGQVFLAVCSVGDTGRMWRPRPVELAIITEDGQELTTLVNPERDLGSARAQFGISARDVSIAPTLLQAWGALQPYLAGRIALGVHIDERLQDIDFELKRHGHVEALPIGLDVATDVQRHDLAGLHARDALTRARTVRDIALRSIGGGERPLSDEPSAFPGQHESFGVPSLNAGFLLPRAAGSISDAPAVTFQVGGTDIVRHSQPQTAGHELLLDMLGPRVSGLVADPWAFEVLTALEAVTGLSVIGPGTELTPTAVSLPELFLPDARVCFTGTAWDAAGQEIPRERLEEIARSRGLVPVNSVTKSRCEVLVCAEAGTQSGKARKAAQYGKPIVTVQDFTAWADAAPVPNQAGPEQGAPTVYINPLAPVSLTAIKS